VNFINYILLLELIEFLFTVCVRRVAN